MSLKAASGRKRFTVELRSGETTIVSWKKLLIDATTCNAPPTSITVTNGSPPPATEAPPAAPSHPSVDARFAPVPDGQDKEGPPTSRLSTGKASSDEEDCTDVVPDDDEYDTEDSFIDDADLDEYFQVDNSAIKHDGFFVNRGKLERIESTELPNQHQKKRRRKDLTKDSGRVAVNHPNKHLKLGNKIGKTAAFDGKHASNPSHIVALPYVRPEDVKLQNHVSAPEIPLKKIITDSNCTYEATCSGESNGDGRRQEEEIQKQDVGPSKNSVGEMSVHRNSHLQGKSPPGRSFTKDGEPNTEPIDYSSSHERAGITPPVGNKPMQLQGFMPRRGRKGQV